MVAGGSYLTLMKEAAPQREYPMREMFNALRYGIRYGIAWRAMPNDFPPWAAVYQQMQRWMAAECFDALAHDLRALLLLAAGRKEEPTTAIIDSRTLRSTPESGPRAGYDGAKRKRGSKVHLAVDTLGHLLALHVTPADVGDRAAVGRLAADIQDATGDTVTLAFVDQGYTGQAAATAAQAEGITLNRRQSSLRPLRVPCCLRRSAPERLASLSVQGLPQGFQPHVRHPVRVPQDAAAYLPRRYRDLLQRG